VRNFTGFPLMIVSAILFSSCMFVPPATEVVAPSKNDMSLVWSDEFSSGSVPDSSKWDYATGGGGWGNEEVQTYTDASANSYVSGDTLKIKAVKSGSAWTSARLLTKGKQSWTYGYLEIRAKLPVGLGTWPAIWMLPESKTYGAVLWPDNGEIDIMEHSQTTGLYKVFGTVHRNAGSGGNGASAGYRYIGSVGSQFHTYAIEWNANEIKWFYDDEYLGIYRRSGGSGWSWWPFDQPFYLVLNVAMGGTLGGTINSALTGDIMEVDYVRVYQ